MKTKAEIVRLLIEHTQQDFVSYYASTTVSALAKRIIELALCLDPALVDHERELDKMLPDTEDDRRWEASYAINTGGMMLSLIEIMRTDNQQSFKDAVTLFFDTVDFKVQQALEASGICRPTESQIASHELMAGERAWFSEKVAC